MQPSAYLKYRSMVSARAPVLSSTGTFGSTASRTEAITDRSGSAPAIAPDTRITSARLETTVDFATAAGVRLPTLEADSGVVFMNTARAVTSRRRRSRSNWAASGDHSPMSDSHAPVATSRIKDAPVAAATARAQRASHRQSTPNGKTHG